MSFLYKPSTYNVETKQQLWMSVVGDTHDSFCSCDTPFAHALDLMFPVGHTDRNLTVDQIITRDSARWHSGGTEDKNHGLADGEEEINMPQREEDDLENIGDEEIEELIAAADAATER